MELISKDAAIGLLLEKGMITAAIYIERIPSAEKTGVWVGIDDFPHDTWECDGCGYIIEGERTNYCPNCGALMENTK